MTSMVWAARPLRIALATTTFVVAGIVISACGGSSSSSASASSGGGGSASASAKTSCPVRVLLVTDTTGAGSQNGLASLSAAKVGIAQVNKGGGVLGCPVALTFKDEGGDPTQDVPLVQQALSSHSYADVITADFGGGSAVPYLMRRKVLMITSLGAGIGNPKVNPYFFDVVPTAGSTDVYAVKAAVGQGHKKIAVLVQNNDIGNGSEAGFKAGAAQYGGQIVDVERVDPNATDATPAVLRARNSGAQALIIDVGGAVTAHVLNDIANVGWKVPTYGGLALFASNIAGLVPPSSYANLLATGSAVATYPSPPVVQQFIAALKGTPALKTNLLQAANIHDDIILLAWAANQTHSLDPATITKFLEDHGNSAVPGLLMAVNTGYSPTSHDFHGAHSVALAKAGPFLNEQLKRIAYEN